MFSLRKPTGGPRLFCIHSILHKIPGMWKVLSPSITVISHEVQVKPLPGIQGLQKVFLCCLLGFCLVKHLSVNREDHTHAAVSCRPWSDKPLNPCGLQSALTTLLTESPESLLLLGEKNPQGIPQIMRSCPSKFKWRTRVLGFRNGQTSGGKERAHSLSLTQKTCVFQGCLPNPAQPEERGRKDHRRNPAELPRHWWFWQFRTKELKMRHSFFSHHSYSLTNTDSPGRNFILYPLWTGIWSTLWQTTRTVIQSHKTDYTCWEREWWWRSPTIPATAKSFTNNFSKQMRLKVVLWAVAADITGFLFSKVHIDVSSDGIWNKHEETSLDVLHKKSLRTADPEAAFLSQAATQSKEKSTMLWTWWPAVPGFTQFLDTRVSWLRTWIDFSLMFQPCWI